MLVGCGAEARAARTRLPGRGPCDADAGEAFAEILTVEAGIEDWQLVGWADEAGLHPKPVVVTVHDPALGLVWDPLVVHLPDCLGLCPKRVVTQQELVGKDRASRKRGQVPARRRQVHARGRALPGLDLSEVAWPPTELPAAEVRDGVGSRQEPVIDRVEVDDGEVYRIEPALRDMIEAVAQAHVGPG